MKRDGWLRYAIVEATSAIDRYRAGKSQERSDPGEPRVAPRWTRLIERALVIIGTCRSWPLIWRLGIAAGLVVAALTLRLSFLGGLEERLVYVGFYPAITIAAILGGFAAGVLATLLSALLAHALLAPLSEAADWLALATFLVSGSVVVAMVEALYVAQGWLAAAELNRQSEERQRVFTAQAPVAMAMFDPQMRYLALSDRWMTDYRLEQSVIGRSHYDVFPEISDAWRDVHRRGQAGETVRAEEDAFRRLDGSVQWLRWEVRPWYRPHGDVGGIIILSEDISERKDAQKALTDAARLEAIGLLAGGIAHDFNNLLAVIAGNLELLEQRTEDSGERELIRRALEATEAGASFNRRLLSIAGRRRLAATYVDVNSRIGETAELLKCTLGEDIEFAVELATDLWPVLADPGEIDSALLNLAVNARDAMPKGGILRVSTANVTADKNLSKPSAKAQPHDYVRLSVVDTGKGMTEDVRRRAMDLFFTTKEPGKGTGLGLNSVHSFAQQSGGFVTLASEVGQGTNVSMYLPRADGVALLKWPTATGEAVPLGDGELVLVVEDDDRVREVTLKRLEALGYVVAEARSGPEALDLLKSDDSVQLVFSDIGLPGGMSGHELARLVRTARPRVQVLLTSGHNRGADVNGTSSHPEVVLDKPFTRKQLAGAVRGALDRRSRHVDRTSLVKT